MLGNGQADRPLCIGRGLGLWPLMAYSTSDPRLRLLVGRGKKEGEWGEEGEMVFNYPQIVICEEREIINTMYMAEIKDDFHYKKKKK